MYRVCVLKYKNSESNTNDGHIHAADELGGLGSSGRAGAGRLLPAAISRNTRKRVVFTLTYLRQCYVF